MGSPQTPLFAGGYSIPPELHQRRALSLGMPRALLRFKAALGNFVRRFSELFGNKSWLGDPYKIWRRKCTVQLVQRKSVEVKYEPATFNDCTYNTYKITTLVGVYKYEHCCTRNLYTVEHSENITTFFTYQEPMLAVYNSDDSCKN